MTKSTPTALSGHLSVKSGFTWDNVFRLPEPSGELESSDSEGDDDSDSAADRKPVTGKTRQEKKAEQVEEEKRLYQVGCICRAVLVGNQNRCLV